MYLEKKIQLTRKEGINMNNLMKIEVNENHEQLVGGRELHEFLEIGTQYSK
jgi:hypothetical protein